jgi:kynureninase
MNSGPGNASGCLYMKTSIIILNCQGSPDGGDIIKNAVSKWEPIFDPEHGAEMAAVSNLPVLLAPYLASVELFDEIGV